jgi:BatD DUF11 like domain
VHYRIEVNRPTKGAGTLRRAVRGQAFARVLGGRHMECAYDFDFCRLGLCLLFLIHFAAPLSAQSPKIKASVDTQEIFIGESVEYQIEIRNVETPPKPDLSAVRLEFDIEPKGDESRNQSSTTILNGRMSQRNIYNHIYTYRLKPKLSGKLTIPAATAILDGKSLATNPIEITVQEAEEQDLVIVRMIASQAEIFPTQSFSVSLRVLVKPIPNSSFDPVQVLRRRPPHLQTDLVNIPEGLKADDKSLSKSGAGFTINDFSTQSGSLFDSPKAAVFDLRSGRETRKDLEGNEVEYYVYEMTRNFTAERTGTYSFGPAVVKGTFVTGSDGTDFNGKKFVAIAPAIQVLVQDVPSPRPATFTGGIGSYSVKAIASRTKLRVGDPLTLNLDFERGANSGSLELLSAPDLGSIESIVNDFDIIDSNPTGRVDGDTKKFGYAIRPKRQGVSVPPITLSTFDPVAQKFVEITTQPIALEVAEASQVSSAELVGAMAKASSNDIKMSSKGIFQNITNPQQLRDDRVSLVRTMLVVAGVWCAMGMGMLSVLAIRRTASDTTRQRRQRATRMAHAKLNEAKQMVEKPKEMLRTVRSAIVGLVADTQNRIVDGMTVADVRDALVTANVPTDDKASVEKLLSTIESSEYGAGDEMDSTALIHEAAQLIDRIAPYLQRSPR